MTAPAILNDKESRANRESRGPLFVLCVDIDPWSDAWGGQVTFAKHIIRAFGPKVAVASTSIEKLPEGVWVERPFEGIPIRYFSFGHFLPSNKMRPIIPARVSVFWMVRKHIRAIFDTGVRNLMVDDPELLFPASKLAWESICYRFAGVNNPVSNSRYPMFRWLGGAFEWKMAKVLASVKPSAIIAAADENAIAEFKNRVGPPLHSYTIHSFPTRVSTAMFYPEAREAARQRLGLPPDVPILAATGRLSWIKGWPLLLDMLCLLKDALPGVQLIFVGDGEDRRAILDKARTLGIEDRVLITGFVPQPIVRSYINAADVCLVGSFREGWSLAMLETLACGKPIVSTDVSGARSMIRNGVNGFVVMRDPHHYADAVVETFKLSSPTAASLEIARRFSVETLADDLTRIWPVLAEN